MSQKETPLKAEVAAHTDAYAIIFIEVITDLSPEDMAAVSLAALQLAAQLKTTHPNLELYEVVKASINRLSWPKLKNFVLPHQVDAEYLKTFKTIYTIADHQAVRFVYNTMVQLLNLPDKFYSVSSLEEVKEKMRQLYD